MVIMKNKHMIFFVAIFAMIATVPMAFADSANVELLDLEHSLYSNSETITIKVYAMAPLDDFVTVKLINSDGEIAHMLWYKIKSESITFTHTFIDIEKLSKKGVYTIQVESEEMMDKRTVRLF